MVDVSELLASMGPEGAALALLVLGHVLGDFALQTEAMVHNKHRPGPLLAHGAVVTVAQALALAPMLTPRTGGLVLAVGVSHVAVDGVKGRLHDDDERNSLALFVGDQLVHLLVLLVAWVAMTPAAWTASPAVVWVDGVSPRAWSQLASGAVYASAFVFAWHGGNAIVRGVLPDWEPERDDEDLGAGATIGGLERWIVLVLGLAGRWEAVALVLAAKSIARFEELKRRPFAEYFLIGTLASVLVAVVSALVVGALV